jgi:hypothetical protein
MSRYAWLVQVALVSNIEPSPRSNIDAEPPVAIVLGGRGEFGLEMNHWHGNTA